MCRPRAARAAPTNPLGGAPETVSETRSELLDTEIQVISLVTANWIPIRSGPRFHRYREVPRAVRASERRKHADTRGNVFVAQGPDGSQSCLQRSGALGLDAHDEFGSAVVI